MSSKYSLVLRYYKMGAWNIARVRAAVVQGWITSEEFAEITGESYE